MQAWFLTRCLRVNFLSSYNEKLVSLVSHVRGLRQIEMQAFPLDLYLPRKLRIVARSAFYFIGIQYFHTLIQQGVSYKIKNTSTRGFSTKCRGIFHYYSTVKIRSPAFTSPVFVVKLWNLSVLLTINGVIVL